MSQPDCSFIRWVSSMSAHFRGKWEEEKGKVLLSRKGDKATNPAAATKGEESMSVLLRIAEFNFNTIKEEEEKKGQNNSKYKVIWKSFG